MTRRRARWLATTGAVAFLYLAVASGLDRYSEHQPSAQRLVPQMVSANAARVLTAQALIEGEATRAAQAAAKAIDADPLDPRGPGFLATALASQGNLPASIRAYAAAEQLGMREPLVQAEQFDRAMAAGDFAGAARRLDILLRAHPSMTSLNYFFTALEGDDRARIELVRRLSQDSLWSTAYLGALGESDDVLRSRARFLASVADEANLGCVRIEPMMRELTKRNYRAEAQRLLVAQCPQQAMSQLLADPGFEAIGDGSPFGWRRYTSGDVRVAVVGQRDKSVEIENRAAVTRMVLTQPVAIEPGEYRIFASVSGRGADRAMASLDCGRPERPGQSGGSLGRGQLVSVTACPDPILGIWLRPGEGAVRIDDIRISRVGN